MAAAPPGKHSLYRLAAPLESSEQKSLVKAPEQKKGEMLPSSSPRRLPPSPSANFPSADHTHSLSLSDSDSDTTVSATTQHYLEPHPPTHIVTSSAPAVSSSTRSVLVVNVEEGAELLESTEVQVTMTQAPSPAKVVRHSPEEYGGEDWRRFSSSFVSLPDLGKPREGGGYETSVQQSHDLQDDSLDSSKQYTVPADLLQHQDHDHSSLSSASPSDSLDTTELSALAEAAHVKMTGGGGGGGSIGRSASEELMQSRKERKDSLHSKSAELNTTQEHPDTSGTLEHDYIIGSKKKRKKGRVVPSRYMTAATSFKKPSQPPSHLQNTPMAKKTGVKPPKAKMEDSFKIPALPPRVQSSRQPSHPPPFSSSLHTSLMFTPSTVMTSTPAVTPQVTATQHGVSHEGSFMAQSTADHSILTGSKLNKSQLTSSTARGKPREPTSSTARGRPREPTSSTARGKPREPISEDLELELLRHRLLQVAYLDVMSAKALREQEEKAKVVEQKKQENAVLKKKIETEERLIALEKSLEVQLQGLGPVCGMLPTLLRQYSALATALDATRHEMAVKGVLPVDEDQLRDELLKSEQLLGEIVAAVKEKIPKVSSFAESTEAFSKTLEREFQELESCWKELSKVTRTQIHVTSLFFEERQRCRHLEHTDTAPSNA